ncbi:MAG: type II secretion system protein [Thiobacillus sp.]
MKMIRNMVVKKSSGFTIVELLVIVVIIAILATIAIIVFNPGETFKQTRDATRQTDLKALDRAVALYQTSAGTPPGSTNIIYLSLPDANANCSSYTLPTLPAGWSYACKPSSTYRNVDGTGWVPIDLNGVDNAKLSQLPTDPINTATNRLYYYYMTNGTGWEFNSQMEGLANIIGGSSDKTSTDGGDDPTRLEVGNNLAISPWSFEFTTFPTVANNSRFPGWYANVTSSVTTGSDGTAQSYARFAGYGWYIWQENIPFNPDSTYKMTCTFRQVTDPTVGAKGIYCGWTGVGSDGVTLVNYTGVNGYGSQHYHTAAYAQLTAGGAWTSFTGYTKGFSSTNGNSSACPNIASPCKMHPNVRYIRPLFIVNYNAGNGTADIDSIVITKS